VTEPAGAGSKVYGDLEVQITGIGVTTAVGQGKESFAEALFTGAHAFGVMKRAGRGLPAVGTAANLQGESPAFLGAEIGALALPAGMHAVSMRSLSLSAQVALITVDEAWREARLDDVDPRRIGLIVGGSNLQQRELTLTHAAYRHKVHFLRPTYGFAFLDSDLCGACSERFGIQGFTYTLGGASASGQLAIIQASEAVRSGAADVCIAVGALMDLSYWECQALRTLGAMGSTRYFDNPEAACRPFDRGRDGFIYGEACGALVVERAESASRRQVQPYARILAGALGTDGNRNPDPSVTGESRVIAAALERAQWAGHDVDYINPHGTGSPLGDDVEVQAIRACGIEGARINATKSIVGHSLSASGAVEVAATLLQMRHSRLHPTRNLVDPIANDLPWVRGAAEHAVVRNALCLSMGFGGLSSALCVQKC
jgi:malonyl-ACP decarboxylase